MFEHLLVPIDGSDLSERAISASIELAGKLHAAITGFVVEPDVMLPAAGRHPSVVLHESESADAAAAAHAKSLLEHFRTSAKEAGVTFHSHFVRTSNVDQAILTAADEKHCDLIVMVTHGRGAFGELLFGSHTKTVLSKSKVPLLVLH
jgi:nucleotide-binding universal stress UspA family protein